MSKSPVLAKLEKEQMKKNVAKFNVGDTVRVHTRIIEGEKERVQVFTGTVIARKGCGIAETFSVHRVAYGKGMERVFLLHSNRIAKIEVVKEGKVRRGKLYYLRGTSGKAAKVEGRMTTKSKMQLKQEADDANQELQEQNSDAAFSTASEAAESSSS